MYASKHNETTTDWQITIVLCLFYPFMIGLCATPMVIYV